MKSLRVFLFLALLTFNFSSVVQPTLAQTLPATGNGHTIYLPLVTNGTSSQTPTSFDLIDQDIASGKLSAEQGLIYKVFAQFSDARLPAKYVSGALGRGGELIMEDVAVQAATLSASAKQTLTPFFVPPNDSRSWFYLSHMGSATASSQPQATPASWLFKPTASGKVKVYYYSTNASDAVKATQIAAQFDAIIWSKLTTLMQKTPLPNTAGTTDIYLWGAYLENDGTTVVPFDKNTLGITVGAACSQSSVTIYLPDNLPVGSARDAGLIQYATHEFMHAIQYAYPIQACRGYKWLKEATATWAEDYVYPLANSEQETAPGYLNHPTARLDNTSDLHDYGAYLLFYFLTHQIDPSAAIIRNIWQNAGTTANSYLAVDQAVSQVSSAAHDAYWPLYLATLWNKAPFTTYYATHDGLIATVNPAGGAAIPITTPGGEQVTPLYAQIPTGGALFFDLKFPDTSVRSVTVLNGLGNKLSTGDASSVTQESTDGDETYLTQDLPASDLQGATVELLLKAHNQAAQGYPTVLTDNLGSNPEASYCLDVQGPLDEMTVILSNADFANPDRIMQPTGLPVTVWANNVPCWKVTGTASAIDYDDGVTTEAQGTVTFGWPSAMPVPQPYWNLSNTVFPEINLRLLSAQVHWSVSGTDSGGCTSSGSGDYTSDEAANDYLLLEQGLTPGSPTYRGYVGSGGPDTDLTDTYHVVCSWGSYDEPIGGIGFLDIPLGQFRSQIKVNANGSMSGNVTVPNYTGRYQQYQWNLTGVKK